MLDTYRNSYNSYRRMKRSYRLDNIYRNNSGYNSTYNYIYRTSYQGLLLKASVGFNVFRKI